MQNVRVLRQKINTMKYFWLSLFTILCSLSLSACATQESPIREKSRPHQNYTPKVSGKTAPMMRPIQERLLKLIDSLHKPEDFTPQLVTRATGVRAVPDEDSSEKFRFYQYLEDPKEGPWTYVWNVDKNEDGRVMLGFFLKGPVVGDWNLANICMDKDEVQRGMQALDYKNIKLKLPSDNFNRYERGSVVLDVFSLKKNDQNPDHYCVSDFSAKIYPTQPQGEK